LPERPKKRKLWDVNPSIFELGRKASFFERRIFPPLRQTAKFGLYALAIAYPIYLVYIGIAFGGLVFWSFFVGSIALIGIAITKLGFLVATGFYAGIIYFKIWLVPIALGLFSLGLLLVLRRARA
jgi:hypothetical protein